MFVVPRAYQIHPSGDMVPKCSGVSALRDPPSPEHRWDRPTPTVEMDGVAYMAYNDRPRQEEERDGKGTRTRTRLLAIPAGSRFFFGGLSL